MWVVQEVCLASRAVLFHRGREMDWADFCLAMSLLQACVTTQNRIVPAPAAFERAYELVHVRSLYRAALTSTQTADQQLLFVSRLSHTLRARKCKLDHDRVYALLSLQPEGSPLGEIVPSYNKPVLQVFREFATKQLELGVLDVLYNAGAWERHGLFEYLGFTLPTLGDSESLPTWAPDLRQEARNPCLPWLKHFLRQQLVGTSLKPDPAAAPIKVVETSRGFGLEVEAIILDRIKVATASP